MVNYKKNIKKKKLSSTYWNMRARCYSEDYQKRNPKYVGCTVCPEWMDNKQTFYDWMKENYYTVDDDQMDLDKDILVKGNKIYSPDTCIFVPHVINSYFENLTRKPVYLSTIGKYRMDIWIENRNISLGYFDSEEEAKMEFIKHKEAAILAKADMYKNKIPKELYDAMINWKIELSDWNK